MNRFDFNFCLFLAMLLCPTIALNLNLEQSFIFACIVFIVVIVSFIIVFSVQQVLSRTSLDLLFVFIAAILFTVCKFIMKAYFVDIYLSIESVFDFAILPILLSGVAIDYLLDDRNSISLFSQILKLFGIMVLNVVSFSMLGFFRELFSVGTVWGRFVLDADNTFFNSPVFSLLYIGVIFGFFNSLYIMRRKNKKMFNNYCEKIESKLNNDGGVK